MTTANDYRRFIAGLATYGCDKCSSKAANFLREREHRAHWCPDWDYMFLLVDSPEVGGCHCEFVDECCQKPEVN